MPGSGLTVGDRVLVERRHLDALLAVLRDLGHRVIGPVVRDGAIVYDEVEALGELPIGWGDRQSAGHYRLVKRSDDTVFAYNLGPDTWKKYLFPAQQKLFEARRREQSFEIIASDVVTPRYAFLGVRACELQAMDVQDRVFMGDDYADPHYSARRERAFIVAVNCSQAAATCFCTSMESGPAVHAGHDLSLTEFTHDGEHLFLVEVGSERGTDVLARLEWRTAAVAELAAATLVPERTREAMDRRLDTDGIRELLLDNPEHPHWQAVAERCLSCANCTLVCPTCFCSAVEERNAIDGQSAQRWRRWDSCFNTEFSLTHAGGVRSSVRSRYRQWLTHKFATWFDQFGSSGCVGCGRCIAWCPAGIDITAELAALREEVAAPQTNFMSAGPKTPA